MFWVSMNTFDLTKAGTPVKLGPMSENTNEQASDSSETPIEEKTSKPTKAPRLNKAGEPIIRVQGLKGKKAKWVRERLKDPEASPSEIGRRAGYSQPANGSYRVSRSENVRAELQRLMDLHPELTSEGLAKGMAEGVMAKKVTRHYHKGELIGTHRDIDHAERRQSRDQALRIKGALRDDDVQGPQGVTEVLLALRAAREARGLPAGPIVDAEVIPEDTPKPANPAE